MSVRPAHTRSFSLARKQDDLTRSVDCLCCARAAAGLARRPANCRVRVFSSRSTRGNSYNTGPRPVCPTFVPAVKRAALGLWLECCISLCYARLSSFPLPNNSVLYHLHTIHNPIHYTLQHTMHDTRPHYHTTNHYTPTTPEHAVVVSLHHAPFHPIVLLRPHTSRQRECSARIQTCTWSRHPGYHVHTAINTRLAFLDNSRITRPPLIRLPSSPQIASRCLFLDPSISDS